MISKKEMIKKVIRFTETELKLIQSTFKDNALLLEAVRRHMLQLELSDMDRSLLNFNTEVIQLLEKTFIMELDGDNTVDGAKSYDMYNNLDNTVVLPEIFVLNARSIDLFYEYLSQQIARLTDMTLEETISLDKLKTPCEGENRYVNLSARKQIIMHVDRYILELATMAEQSMEDIENRVEEMYLKNSNK
jgi:hypothetical protein